MMLFLHPVSYFDEILCRAIRSFALFAHWCGLGMVAMIESTRQIGNRSSTERRNCIISLGADAKRLDEAIRGHWGIENSMYGALISAVLCPNDDVP